MAAHTRSIKRKTSGTSGNRSRPLKPNAEPEMTAELPQTKRKTSSTSHGMNGKFVTSSEGTTADARLAARSKKLAIQAETKARNSRPGVLRLLDLPTELRLMILEQLFDSSDLVPSSYTPTDCNRAVDAPITRVCRTLRVEALPLDWASKAIAFDFSNDERVQRAKAWAERAAKSPIRAASMRKVSFFGFYPDETASLIVDLRTSRIIDARWWERESQNRTIHYHMLERDLVPLQETLDHLRKRKQRANASLKLASVALHAVMADSYFLVGDDYSALPFAITSPELCGCTELHAPQIQ